MKDEVEPPCQQFCERSIVQTLTPTENILSQNASRGTTINDLYRRDPLSAFSSKQLPPQATLEKVLEASMRKQSMIECHPQFGPMGNTVRDDRSVNTTLPLERTGARPHLDAKNDISNCTPRLHQTVFAASPQRRRRGEAACAAGGEAAGVGRFLGLFRWG